MASRSKRRKRRKNKGKGGAGGPAVVVVDAGKSAGRPTEKSNQKKLPAPVKGGDGSRYVKPKRGRHWNANGQVYLTGKDITESAALGAFLDSLVPTRDEGDRAHAKRRLIHPSMPPHMAESWMYEPMCELQGRGRRLPGRVRRYHPSQMVSSGVAFDSMFDEWCRTAGRLQAAGIELGMHTRLEHCSMIELNRAVALSGCDSTLARAMIQQKTTQSSMTKEERRAERVASRMLHRAAEQERRASGGAE